METTTEQSSSLETRRASQPVVTSTTTDANHASPAHDTEVKSNIPATEVDASSKPPLAKFNEENAMSTLTEAFKPREEAIRRIIAEDPEWNLAPVDKLADICLAVIVKNFEKNPILKGIPAKYRDNVIDSISTDLPLSISAPLIPDEKYWQRRSKRRFKLGQVKNHGGSWKRMFFELHLAQCIEQFCPSSVVVGEGEGKNGFKTLLEEVKISAPFVEKLVLSQLKPMDTVMSVSTGDAPPILQPSLSKPKLLVHERTPLDHVDLQLILSQLKDLKEFQVYYGARDCGINFTWSYFGMTLNDALKLSSVLNQASSLRKLIVQSSGIDDDKCRLLCHGILENATSSSGHCLDYVDLSHNRIGDAGIRGIAKLLATAAIKLKYLNLTNNQIQKEGADVLGKALAQNTVLETLELRLNQLSDDGGAALFTGLVRNKKLRTLNVSGNGLGKRSVGSLCLLLRKNNPFLCEVDLSCNKLGSAAAAETETTANTQNARLPTPPTEGKSPTAATNFTKEFGNGSGEGDGDLSGKMIFEAISQNKYMTHMDLRMTDLSPDYIVAIQGILYENSGN